MWKERGFFDQQNSNEKKYVETTWKFVEIWFWTHRRSIQVDSAWIRCGVPVGYLEC